MTVADGRFRCAVAPCPRDATATRRSRASAPGSPQARPWLQLGSGGFRASPLDGGGETVSLDVVVVVGSGRVGRVEGVSPDRGGEPVSLDVLIARLVVFRHADSFRSLGTRSPDGANPRTSSSVCCKCAMDPAILRTCARLGTCSAIPPGRCGASSQTRACAGSNWRERSARSRSPAMRSCSSSSPTRRAVRRPLDSSPPYACSPYHSSRRSAQCWAIALHGSASWSSRTLRAPGSCSLRPSPSPRSRRPRRSSVLRPSRP